MSGLIGADPQDLNNLATAMDQGARSLDQARTQLGGFIKNVRWNGEDAFRARSNFNTKHAPQLSTAAVMLRETADRLRKQATEQENASAADGGELGTGAGFAQDPGRNLPFLGGAKGEVDVGFGPDGETSKTVTVTGKAGIKESTSFDNVPGLGKVGVDAGISAVSSYSAQASTSKDWDTYKVTSVFGVEGSAGIDLKKFGLKGTIYAGDELTYQLKVPHGVDPSTIDVNNPASWPKGTTLQVDESTVRKNGQTVSYGPLSADGTVTNKDGTARIVTRNADGSVSVMDGPKESIKNSFKLGVGFDEFKASFGADKSLEQSAYRSVTFDPNSDAGKSALAGVLNGGGLPAKDGPGLSDVKTVETTAYNHSLNANVSLPGASASWNGESTSTTQIVTTNGDGRTDVVATSHLPGAPDLVRSNSLDPSGHVVPGSTKYEFHLKDISQADTEVLNQPQYSGVYGGVGLKEGDNVTVTFTQSQLNEYYAKAQSEYKAAEGASSMLSDTAQLGGYPAENFPIYLQQSAMNGQMLTEVFRFSGGGGDGGPSPDRFPGTVAKK